MTQPQSDFPAGLGQPATKGALWSWLPAPGAVNQTELKQLHGMGPKAIRILSSALEAKGLSFAEEKSGK